MVDTRMASRAVFWSSCRFGGAFGATRESCIEMTRIAARNLHGCALINCGCPLRVCRVCTTQGTSELVVEPREKGLCAFHKEHGESVRIGDKKSEKKLPGSEDEEDVVLPFARRASRAEAIKVGDRFTAMSVRPPDLEQSPLRFGNGGPAPYAGSAGGTQKPPAPTYVRKNSQPSRRKKPTTGYVMVYDEAAGKRVRKSVLEVLDLICAMHDRPNGMKWKHIRTKLKLGAMVMGNLRSIRKLVPEVRALLSLELPCEKRLGYSIAARIASMRPELQLAAAQAYIAGTLTMDRLIADSMDPANRPS